MGAASPRREAVLYRRGVANARRRRASGRPRTDAPPHRRPWSLEAAKSEPILDLVGPIAFQAEERDIHPGEVIAWDAADLFDRTGVLLVNAAHDAMHLLAQFAPADSDRATVDARARMMEVTHLDQLLAIVGNIRPEIVPPRS